MNLKWPRKTGVIFNYLLLIIMNKNNNLKITIISPAGNVTALVEDFEDQERYADFATNFLESEAARKNNVEQVGYIEPVTKEGASSRLGMAGGELCVNAARSLAALLGARSDLNQIEFNLEVSGYTDPELRPMLVPAIVDKISDGLFDVSLKWNTAAIFVDSKSVNLDILGQSVQAQQVTLTGIDHLFIPLQELPEVLKEIFDHKNAGRSASNYPKLKSVFEQLYLDNPELNEFEAVGLVAYEKTLEDVFSIHPVVRVKKQKSIYYETACGSATIALALLKNLENGYDSAESVILQPSGSKLLTSIVSKDDISTIIIKGPVQIVDEVIC